MEPGRFRIPLKTNKPFQFKTSVQCWPLIQIDTETLEVTK